MIIRLNKKFAGVFSVLLILSMLLLTESCIAPGTKPATPTFTIQEISQPYNVPPSTTIIVDPYTGEETTITNPGYTVENKTTCLVIKNQPFTPYKNDSGQTMSLYYTYSYRGHYSDGGWTLPYPRYYEQSNSEYTMIPFNGLTSSGQVDVQVRALIGILVPRMPVMGESGDRFYYSFEGIEGDYSVITVSSDMVISTTTMPSSPSGSSGVEPTGPENSDTTNPNPPQQQTPWATYLLTIIITTGIILIPMTIVMYYNKRQQRKTNTLRLHKS